MTSIKKIVTMSILSSIALGQTYGMLSRVKPPTSSSKKSSSSPKTSSQRRISTSAIQQKNLREYNQKTTFNSASSIQSLHKSNRTKSPQETTALVSFIRNPFIIFSPLLQYFSLIPKQETTALHTATLNNNFNDVKTIVAENSSSINTQDENGNTALYFAVSNNNTEMVRILIDAALEQIQNSMFSKFSIFFGRHPTWLIKNNEGKNPFNIAIEQGNIDLIMIFLQKGALLQNNTTYEPDDPVNLAITDMRTQLAKARDKQEAKSILQSILIERGITQESRELIESVEPTLEEQINNTKLIETIKENDLDGFKKQLDLGSDLLSKNKNGLRPIDYIAMSYNEEIIKEIIKKNLKLPFCREKQPGEAQKSQQTFNSQGAGKNLTQHKNLTNTLSRFISFATAHGIGASILDIKDRDQFFKALEKIKISLEDDNTTLIQIQNDIEEEEKALQTSDNQEKSSESLHQVYKTALKTALSQALKSALKALCSAMGLEYAATFGASMPKVGNIPKKPLKTDTDQDSTENSLEGSAGKTK